jgi:SNARE domain
MAQNTRSAAKELVSASRLQKNARKRACWLILILCVILTIVLLAVEPLPLSGLIIDSELEIGCQLIILWEG